MLRLYSVRDVVAVDDGAASDAIRCGYDSGQCSKLLAHFILDIDQIFTVNFSVQNANWA